jgi:hypothetical protein
LTAEERRNVELARVEHWQRAKLLQMGVPFSDLIRMTPAQIHGLGFYPRKEGGDLKTPRVTPEQTAPEPSLARDLCILESFRPFIAPQKYHDAKAKLEAMRGAGAPKESVMEKEAPADGV